MKEIVAIVTDDHTDGEIHPSPHFVMEPDGRLRGYEPPKREEYHFNAADGSGFVVRAGDLLSVRYEDEPLQAENGLVREVTGFAARDQEGHLVLTKADFIYEQKFAPNAPEPTSFMLGYIPGLLMTKDDQVLLAIPDEEIAVQPEQEMRQQAWVQ